MKKPFLFLGSLFLLILLLSVVQVVVSNRLSTTGTTLGKLQDDISQYKKENAILREKVLIASSLDHIASSAAELGFAQTKTHVFLSTPLPIALQR